MTDRSAAQAARFKALAVAAAIATVGLVGLVDYATGFEIRISPLYFFPIAFGAWHGSRTTAVGLSVISSEVWVLSNWRSGNVYSSAFVYPVNFTSQLIAFTVVGVLVSELRRRLVAEAAVSREDALTSLPNTRAFHESAELMLAVARRSRQPITFAFLDLDHFKKVNDERGHAEGDRALIAVAQLLKSQFRASDRVARLGGDEFAVVLHDCGPAAAIKTLERLRAVVASTMGARGWPITVSVGAMSYERAPPSLQEALQQSDALMYRAKEGGRNRVHVEATQADAPPAPAAAQTPLTSQ